MTPPIPNYCLDLAAYCKPMLQILRRLLRSGPKPLRYGDSTPPSSLEGAADQWRFSAKRIAGFVEEQLVASTQSSPGQWSSQRQFIYGYVDALADMHVENNGKLPQGPESRALSESVLKILLADAWDRRVMWVFNVWVKQQHADLLLGRAAALDDYSNWDTRPMSGISRRLLGLTPRTGSTETSKPIGD